MKTEQGDDTGLGIYLLQFRIVIACTNTLKRFIFIFIVTWFAGMFYIVRLFIYNDEAGDKPELERAILRGQFAIMIKRLWFGITWPSAVLTLIFGPWMLYLFSGPIPTWLWIKLGFVLGLYLYHFRCIKFTGNRQPGYLNTQVRNSDLE